MGDDVLCIGSAADQTEHAISDRDVAHPRAERIDLSGELETGNVRWAIARRRIRAHALEKIGAVDGGSAHPHAYLTARRLGGRHVAQLENLGTAELGDDDGTHGYESYSTRVTKGRSSRSERQ